MAIGKLRPRDGWRVFAGEVGVIVLGVLIALAAQQAVDEWRWSKEVARTKADLDKEILLNVALGAERVAINPCLTGRLGELGKKLAGSDGQWAANPYRTGRSLAATSWQWSMPLAYRAPLRSFLSDSWEQAKATGLLLHMNPDEVARYSSIYDAVADLRELNKEEWRAIPELSFLAFDGRLDPVLRERGLSRVAVLDTYNATIVLVANQLANAAQELDGRMSATVIDDSRQSLVNQRALRGSCVDAKGAVELLRPLIRGRG